MKNLTSGRWRDRAQKDCRSSSRLVRLACGDSWSKKKKTQRSQSVIERSINPSSFAKPASFRSLFRRPDVATILHFAVFVYVVAQLQVGQAAARGQWRKAVVHDTCGVGDRSVTNLSTPISTPIYYRSGSLGRGTDCIVFVTWCNYRCCFCVREALWRWFYPRSRKRDHFQTLATGVPKLKTWLGTQRVKKAFSLPIRWQEVYHKTFSYGRWWKKTRSEDLNGKSIVLGL